MSQTTTVVHSEKMRELVRMRTQQRENCLSLCTLLYAQLLIMSALSLLSIASSGSWQSVLMLLPPAALLFVLGRISARRAQPPRLLQGVFALCFLSDMALCLLSLTELVCAYVLPHYPRALIALPTAVLCALALHSRQQGAARRTCAFLCAFFLLSLLICLLFALPEGDIGYIFPLFGYGAAQTLRGTLYMTGGVWIFGALPFFVKRTQGAPLRRSRVDALPFLTLVLSALLLFFYAFLLPAPLLPGDWGFVLRLQLIMEMSPSILSWSLMLLSRMLLLLSSYCVAGDYCCECLHSALKKTRFPLYLPALFSALIILLPLHQLLSPLEVLLPARCALVLFALILSLFARKKEASA